MHHGSTKAYFCSSLYSIPYSTNSHIGNNLRHMLYSLSARLGECIASKGGYLILTTCLKQLEMKCNDTPWPNDIPTFTDWALTSIVEMLFMLFSIFNTSCNGINTKRTSQKNFLLINILRKIWCSNLPNIIEVI